MQLSHASYSKSSDAIPCMFLLIAQLQFFSAAYTQNHHLSHSFWKLSLKQQKHTKSVKPYTNSQPLTFQYYKTLFAKHNTVLYVAHKNLSGINIMAKVFANVCFWDVFVIFWMQCFINKRCQAFCILCAVLEFVFKVLKKRGKVLKM